MEGATGGILRTGFSEEIVYKRLIMLISRESAFYMKHVAV
jgi:hypothetical protein